VIEVGSHVFPEDKSPPLNVTSHDWDPPAEALELWGTHTAAQGHPVSLWPPELRIGSHMGGGQEGGTCSVSVPGGSEVPIVSGLTKPWLWKGHPRHGVPASVGAPSKGLPVSAPSKRPSQPSAPQLPWLFSHGPWPVRGQLDVQWSVPLETLL
jgi:hypothetical protein